MQNHKRYFIYRINDDHTLLYREQTGCWVQEYDLAQLWSNEQFVIKKAKELKKNELDWQNRVTWLGVRMVSMHIGTVDVLPHSFNWKEV